MIGAIVVVEVMTVTVVVGAVVVVVGAVVVVLGAVVVVDEIVDVVASVEVESPSEQPAIASATTTEQPMRNVGLRIRGTVPDRIPATQGVRVHRSPNGRATCLVRYGEW